MENKNIIEVRVPEEIQYFSQWKEYEIPYGKCIIDKGITGCGFTELCLTNKDDLIICSPRKLLINNKMDQHKSDKNIFYVMDESLQDAEMFDSYNDPKYGYATEIEDLIPENKRKKKFDIFKENILKHVRFCREKGFPIKFFTTYDSFLRLKLALGEQLIGMFKIVVDEWQSLLIDAAFKPTVELDLLLSLEGCGNITFVSATPILEEYVDKVEFLRGLDWYRFIWSSRYVTPSRVNMRKVHSSKDAIKGVIQSFLEGNFPTLVDEDGNIHVSREAVIYVNSVIDIVGIIRDCKLTPENTDVICSIVPGNVERLKKHGFTISSPNVKSEVFKNKMFTFCTRTVYLGVDLYSDCATSWIMACPSREQMALDISMDLPQILGRQRSDNNPFRSHVTLFVQNSKYYSNEAEYRKRIDGEFQRTIQYIEAVSQSEKGDVIEDFTARLLKRLDCRKGGHCYLALSKLDGGLRVNKLAYLSDLRVIDITKISYYSDVNVKKYTFEKTSQSDNLTDEQISRIKTDFLENVNIPNGTFTIKLLTFLRALRELNPEEREYFILRVSNLDFINYYNLLGPKRISELLYKENLIRAEYERILERRLSGDDVVRTLEDDIHDAFIPGKSYSVSDVKQMLLKIYRDHGLSIAAKSTDLEKYFEVKQIHRLKSRYLLIGSPIYRD